MTEQNGIWNLETLVSLMTFSTSTSLLPLEIPTRLELVLETDLEVFTTLSRQEVVSFKPVTIVDDSADHEQTLPVLDTIMLTLISSTRMIE
jgi:hypothetical protein